MAAIAFAIWVNVLGIFLLIMGLFSDHILLNLEGADIVYYPNFLTSLEADSLYNTLYKETPWQQDDIKVFGKVYAQPRLTALYSNNGKPYSYSNITMNPHQYTPALNTVKLKIEEVSNTVFTTCLINLYRDGKDSNGWHSDDEKELGKNPMIASLSLGEKRVFKLRKKDDHQIKSKIELNHGSLLIMKGRTQHTWQHQIPKTTRTIGPRINLTFRIIK